MLSKSACAPGSLLRKSESDGQGGSVSVNAVTFSAECCDLCGRQWRLMSPFMPMWRRSKEAYEDGTWSKMRSLLGNHLYSFFENMWAFIGKMKHFINSTLLDVKCNCIKSQ